MERTCEEQAIRNDEREAIVEWLKPKIEAFKIKQLAASSTGDLALAAGWFAVHHALTAASINIERGEHKGTDNA